MSGLIKAKKYNWKDTNLALFGSDTEKSVKKESAESEPAWKEAGTEVGLKICRIVKFKVQKWPKEEYSKFYEGDSYIILNTYKEEGEDQLQFDVHFWIGKYSTQVCIDIKYTVLYFITVNMLKGGADTGFRHVEPEKYKPRLLHFSGTQKNVL
ncbi:gelsolin-like protein 2, partial [Gigantopelta aegis]|uniref:gelsolin-like protein 2 n=1 Tax=Gigantopelta aegis TaxID=1735272 RepID=UPI001B88C9FB